MPVVALLGLHLTPPVRELTRDAVAVEARTLARASRLVLKPLARSAAGGPIGRAAIGFTAAPEGDGPSPEVLERLGRVVAGVARLRAVESVSVLVRLHGESGASADLPSVDVAAGDFEASARQGLLPDRLYVVSANDEGEEDARRRGIPARARPRALSSGDPD